MKRSRIHKQLGEMLLGFLIAWTIPAACLAQATFKAQLRGTVQDASKAAVPRATVTLTNEATQVSEKTTTDEQGRYSFNNVQPAEYTVKVEAAGFKPQSESLASQVEAVYKEITLGKPHGEIVGGK